MALDPLKTPASHDASSAAPGRQPPMRREGISQPEDAMEKGIEGNERGGNQVLPEAQSGADIVFPKIQQCPATECLDGQSPKDEGGNKAKGDR